MTGSQIHGTDLTATNTQQAAGTQSTPKGKTSFVPFNFPGHATPIYNDLTGTDLSVVVVEDPQTIRVFRENVANQINTQRQAQKPPKMCEDLSQFIADIIIETTVQGAGLLEVHIIDPAWTLLTRDKDGIAFFDVDSTGYLWPPIDLNFPPDVSGAQWRLCALHPSTDLTDANIILTFEDKCASVLREFTGPVQANTNETRAEFIHRLVRDATMDAPLPSVNMGSYHLQPAPVQKAQADNKIRFISLLPNSDFTAQDLSTPPTSAANGRTNPNKLPGLPENFTTYQSGTGGVINIATGVQAIAQAARSNKPAGTGTKSPKGP